MALHVKNTEVMPSLAEAGVAFCRDQLRRAPAFDADAANKDFIDRLDETD